MKPNDSPVRTLFCRLVPVVLFCVCGLGQGTPQNTPMFRNDLAHSGIYAAAGVPKLNGVKWTFHTHGEVISSPAVVNGTIYVGSNDGNLYAIDQQAGSLKWRFHTDAR